MSPISKTPALVQSRPSDLPTFPHPMIFSLSMIVLALVISCGFISKQESLMLLKAKSPKL